MSDTPVTADRNEDQRTVDGWTGKPCPACAGTGDEYVSQRPAPTDKLAAIRAYVLKRINAAAAVHARDDHSQNCELCNVLAFIDGKPSKLDAALAKAR